MSVLNFAIKIGKTGRRTAGLPNLAGRVRHAAAKTIRFFAHAADAIAEARMQRARIEVELYRRRYKITSKNDDDLPVVR